MTGRGQMTVVAVVLAAIGVGAFAFTHTIGRDLSPLGVGKTAPQFHAATLDTPPRVKSLSDYRGQVVLVNIWATWCEPCRIEIPSIERLYRDYGPKGLKVVAVSVDTTRGSRDSSVRRHDGNDVRCAARLDRHHRAAVPDHRLSGDGDSRSRWCDPQEGRCRDRLGFRGQSEADRASPRGIARSSHDAHPRHRDFVRRDVGVRAG